MVTNENKALAKKLVSSIQKNMTYKAASAAFELCKHIAYNDNDPQYAMKVARHIKNAIARSPRLNEPRMGQKLLALNDAVIKFMAPYDFDSYLIYLEKDREPKERFYLPKRRHFIKHGLISALQDMEDDKLDILSISMPPGTQKTTLEKFFASWVIGRHPEDFSLFFSHSSDMTKLFYEGILDIVTNDIEYKWAEIFPNAKFDKCSAETKTINFGKYKPFASIQCSSVGASNAGKVRCNRYLYCDDLISKIEEAMNNDRLDKLWQVYSVDLKQRKLDGCKELHIATRWSTKDVIGRIKDLYEGNERCRFIAIPDIDPATGKSNFDYDYMGFSEEFFADQALSMDDISYRCLYKNEPIEREGLLYHKDEMRWSQRSNYFDEDGKLLKEPDAILGICDTKNKGTDFLFLPCCLQYGNDYVCVDCICDDNSDYEVQYSRCTNIIGEYNMERLEIESNNGGSRVAHEVNNRVTKLGYRCNITEKMTETNKETRILVAAPWIKKHVIFLEGYKPKSDYDIMLKWLFSYNTVGKNSHDDVPDGWANFYTFVTEGILAKCEPMTRIC